MPLTQKINESDIAEEERMPFRGSIDYQKKFIDERIKWLQKKIGKKFESLSNITEPFNTYKGNIENLIGVARIPIGAIGPLKVNGDFASGEYYIPLATTEGVLVSSFHRGARLITKSGGAFVKIMKKEMHVSPAFKVSNLKEASNLFDWVRTNFNIIKCEAEKTTRFGKLLKITPKLIGNIVLLKMIYDTGDAMGMNMITIASDRAAHLIAKSCNVKTFFPRSNFSSDKKQSAHLFIEGYGRSLHAEAVFPKEIIRYLGTTPQKMFEYYLLQLKAGTLAGMQGINGQVANGIAAIFIATGQDAAQVINSGVGISSCEVTKNGELYLSIELPELLIGTVGGGTRRLYAQDCLKMMDCYGPDKADKFSEIVAALVLAGEFSILGAIASGTFVNAHVTYGR